MCLVTGWRENIYLRWYLGEGRKDASRNRDEIAVSAVEQVHLTQQHNYGLSRVVAVEASRRGSKASEFVGTCPFIGARKSIYLR